MQIIIAPAKQMRVDEDFGTERLPQYIHRTEELLTVLRSLTMAELQELWRCNDKLAQQNYERIQRMELHRGLTPALYAYDGLQYSHMGARVLEKDAWEYLCRHLRILSGFYGILRADDGVTPYRLEMQAHLSVGGRKNLYEYWGDSLYLSLVAEDRVILNLASKEYSKCIEPYLTAEDRLITCVFASGTSTKYKVKATEAKMCRGALVRYCAERQVEQPKQLQGFTEYGYVFQPEISTEHEYIFLKLAGK